MRSRPTACIASTIRSTGSGSGAPGEATKAQRSKVAVGNRAALRLGLGAEAGDRVVGVLQKQAGASRARLLGEQLRLLGSEVPGGDQRAGFGDETADVAGRAALEHRRSWRRTGGARRGAGEALEVGGARRGRHPDHAGAELEARPHDLRVDAPADARVEDDPAVDREAGRLARRRCPPHRRLDVGLEDDRRHPRRPRAPRQLDIGVAPRHHVGAAVDVQVDGADEKVGAVHRGYRAAPAPVTPCHAGSGGRCRRRRRRRSARRRSPTTARSRRRRRSSGRRRSSSAAAPRAPSRRRGTRRHAG